MTATASTLVAPETLAESSDLWALSYLLKADWSNGCTLRSAYFTDIAPAVSDGEQRRGRIGKPQRMMESELKSMDRSQILGLQAAMDRMGSAKTLGPLYCDQSRLTAAATTGGTTLACPTSYRRFTVGARVAVLNVDTGVFAVKVIQAIAAGLITCSTTIGADFPADSLVFPLMECRLNLETGGDVLGEHTVRFKVTFVELPGPWSLDTGQGVGSVPGGFSSYLGYPIVSTPYDYARAMTTTVRRSGQYVSTGVSQHTDVQGDRARHLFKLPFTFFSRAEAWPFLRLHDSRGGRLLPQWIPAPTADYDIIAFTGTGVQVRAVAAEIDWTFRPFIALVKEDGTVQVRTITAHTRAGQVDSLTLDTLFDSSGVITRLTTARLMRHDSDEQVEGWQTDEVVRVENTYIEVTREDDVTIGNIIDPAVESLTGFFNANGGGESSGVVAPMYYWPCPAPSERPLGRAADLLLPVQIVVRIKADDLVEDPSAYIVGPGVSPGLLGAIGDTFPLQYVGPISGTSRHWAHTLVEAGPVFNHHTPAVTRHLWRATKQYIGNAGVDALTIDFVVEWNDGLLGAAGALMNLYVYATDINSGYIEDTAWDDGFTYNKNDPVLLDGTTKRVHPQMVLMASVPTTWTAACGNVGVACDAILEPTSPNPKNGFTDCYDVPNAAPWHNNSAVDAIGSSAFYLRRDMFYGVTFPARPVSMGGGCPTSEIFGHLIIENSLGTGLTALKPIAEKGWDEAAGTLDIVNGSAVEISVCYPPQPEIDCCEGNLEFPFAGSGGSPDCWRSPPNSPETCDPAHEPEEDHPPRRCCFPTDSTVTVTVVQRCRTELHCGEVVTNDSGEATKTYQLTACRVDYWTDGETVDMQNSREFKWAALYRMPEFTFLDAADNFSAGNSLGFTPDQGAWDYSSNVYAEAAGAPVGPHIDKMAVYYTNTYINAVVSVDCLSNTQQGLVGRTTGGNPDDGYGVLVNPATPGTATISIYKFTGSGKTLMAQTTGLTIATPYRLKVTFQGPSISAIVDGDPLLTCSLVDCTYWAAGYFGMIADGAADARFDNFELIDNNPAGYAEIYVLYNQTGWRLTVPASIMPLIFNPQCPTDVPEDCYRTTVTCPTSIDRYWGDYCVAMPDRSLKPGKADCKCDPNDLVGFRCATVRVSDNCSSDPCPEGSISQCRGIDVYIGVYAP